MTDTVTARRSTSGRSVRAVQTLSLTPDELTAPLFAQRLATVADIGVKRKRVNELTTVGTEMRMEVKLQPLPASPEGEERDDDECTDAPRSVLSSANAGTILRNDADRAMIYAYHDPWVDIAVDFGSTPSHPDDAGQPLPTSPEGEESDVDDSEGPLPTSPEGEESDVDVSEGPLPTSPEGEESDVDVSEGPLPTSPEGEESDVDDSEGPLPTSPKGEESDVDDSEGPLPASPEGEESEVDVSAALPFRGGLGGAVGAAAISLVVRDTLTLVEHRVPRRFWFIKFGTKCVKREVVATCPYTEVVMAERIVAM
jgi:hypothetical protein